MNKIINFESGLRLVVERIKNTKSLSIGIFVGVGSLYETKENNGISHFIEHMLFKGTTTRTSYKIVDELESIGVSINAFTSKNITAYYTAGLSEYGDKCMEMLSDMYFNSIFEEESMTKEKSVVLEEIKMTEDDYQDLCIENLCKAHYGKTRPIAFSILGNEKNITLFTKDNIKNFMEENYTPKNTVISLAGNITNEQAIELVEKYFECRMENGYWEKRKLYSNRIKAKYIEKIKNDCLQSHVAISFPGYPLKHKKSIANNVFCSMLSGGMSSRLFQKIREQLGLVYTIYAAPMAYVDDAYIYIYFATDPSQVPLAMTEIKKSLDEIIKDGFTEEELKKTLIQAKTSLALSMESSMSVMRVNARSALLLNKIYNVNRQIKDLEKIDKEEMNKYIDYALDFKKASVSYVGSQPDYNTYEIFMNGKQ